MKDILIGPCPCQGCGLFVWYVRGLGWSNLLGILHRCVGKAVAA